MTHDLIMALINLGTAALSVVTALVVRKRGKDQKNLPKWISFFTQALENLGADVSTIPPPVAVEPVTKVAKKDRQRLLTPPPIMPVRHAAVPERIEPERSTPKRS